MFFEGISRIVAVVTVITSVASAAVTVTGNVDPADPGAWTPRTKVYINDGTVSVADGSTTEVERTWLRPDESQIARLLIDGPGSTWTSDWVGLRGSGTATVSVTGGGQLITDGYASIGDVSAGTWIVTVDGPTSTWQIGGDYALYVAAEFDGALLRIVNGGTVSSIRCEIGGDGMTGLIEFDGGTLTTGRLIGGADQLSGVGTIHTGGLFSDADLQFDAQHGLTQTLKLSRRPGQDLTIHLDLSGDVGSRILGVGNQDQARLTVRDGVVVSCYEGYVGVAEGFTSSAIVEGAGSEWHVENFLNVGTDRGTGTLRIADGGRVVSGGAVLGDVWGQGEAAITGHSTWSAGWLYVGRTSRVDVANGSTLESLATTLYRGAYLSIGVSGDGALVSARSDCSFIAPPESTIRLWADSDAAPGVYTPIEVAGTWDDRCDYEIFGGIWDDQSHTFTIAPVVQAQPGEEVGLDRVAAQRLAVGDALVLNFAPSVTAAPVSVTASPLDQAMQADLQTLLGDDEQIHAGWAFDVTGLGGDEVLLAMALDSAIDPADAELWRYDDQAGWASYDADLLVAGDWAVFSVEGFSAYAVAAVPEPSSLSLLGGFGLAAIGRRRSG